MATNLTVSSNYNGKVAGDIIGASFREVDTLQKGLLTVYPDIDYKISMRLISYADGRTDYTCGFTPQGAITLSEKQLEPKKIKNELEICKEDLRQIWSSATMGFSAHNDRMPADVEQALLTEVLMDTAVATEDNIWQGTDTDGNFEGFITKWASDSDIIKAGNGITSASAAITKSNVIAEFQKVLNATPRSIRRKSDLVYGISDNVARAFEDAYIDGAISSGFGASEFSIKYGSKTLNVISGLPDNTFVVYRKKNLAFGTGLMSDHNEIKTADGDEYGRLDGQVRFKMVYTAGVQYANGDEIVWYLSTT